MKSDLYDRKWSKFLERVRLFRYVPFVEFILVSGSLATGKVREGSDFDVLVSARRGRIFTTRFLSMLVFELAGWRRKSADHAVGAPDKFCLNHFLTSTRYKLQPPYDKGWEELYSSLVPIMGDEEKMDQFFGVNDWLQVPRRYQRDHRYLGSGQSWIKGALEWLLSGRLGDWAESLVKGVQTRRIERGLEAAMGYKGRIIYDDEELQFHPDRTKWAD